MKHPLTSKERRGLAAVAAAALLCIAGGVVTRSCGHSTSPEIRVEHSEVADSLSKSDKSDKSDKADRSDKSSKKKKTKKAKTAPARDRSHLDETLD